MMEFTVQGSQGKRAEAPLFQFVVFGNFSGRSDERPAFVAHEVGRANFDQAMVSLRPTIHVHCELPNVDDLRLSLTFAELRDFSERGIRRQVPLLENLRELREKVAESNAERPLDPASLLAGMAEGARLRAIASANAGSGGGAIDLLEMVDLGDEEAPYPQLDQCLSAVRYHGEKRGQLLAEIDRLSASILAQCRDHQALRQLHGRWRGLRAWLGKCPANVRVHIVDCAKDEVCDALFLTCLQPESGPRLPADLVVCCESFAASEGDRHLIHHLGRMGESLSVPILLETDLALFGLRTYRQVDHLREVGAKLSGPAHLKWRKLREEPGAQWLFMVFNPLRIASDDEVSESETLMPAVFLVASFVSEPLETPGQWPTELLHASSDLASGTAAKISPELGEDMAFWGICAVAERATGELQLRGMTSFAELVSQRGDGRLRQADLVAYALPYRFYIGCCTRMLAVSQDRERFRQWARLAREDAFEIEPQAETQTLRLRPDMTIFGSRPDIILDLQAL